MSSNRANLEPKSIFDGFTLEMVKQGQQRKARIAVTRVLGKGWQVKPFGDSGNDFEAIRKARRKSESPSWAWDKAYQLRAEPGVVFAEPMYTVPISAPPDFTEEAEETKPPKKPKRSDRGFREPTKHPAKVTVPDIKLIESSSATQHLPESDDPDWSIRAVKVIEAWQRFPPNKEPGEKIVIGHPDTGYSDHPEIASRLLKNRGHDYVSDDEDAKDDLNSGLLLFPGHGTGTSSVIVSPKDAQSNFGATPKGKPIAVWGVAPGATLIPLRISRSVVLGVPWAGSGVRNLAHAIELATNRGAHVISISLGTGAANSRLLKAVQYAQRRGVIVLGAAGNQVRFVVWPAAYSEVIAVAASNARGQIWKGSSFGSAVDVTAPGESVWNAGVSARNQFSVGRGSGTSYAVATVAGIAALWLSHHGREKLVKQYGAEKIPIIFNQILRNSCDPVAGWPWGFGRGLVNADKVMTASLPGPMDPVPEMATALVEHPAIDSGGLTTFRHLFESSLRPAGGDQSFASEQIADEYLSSTLSELLQVTREELPARLKEVGQELAFNFAADPILYNQFASVLSQSKEAGAESAAMLASDAAADLAVVRTRLASKSTSKALKQRLS